MSRSSTINLLNPGSWKRDMFGRHLFYFTLSGSITNPSCSAARSVNAMVPIDHNSYPPSPVLLLSAINQKSFQDKSQIILLSRMSPF